MILFSNLSCILSYSVCIYGSYMSNMQTILSENTDSTRDFPNQACQSLPVIVRKKIKDIRYSHQLPLS
jgi:hypothetical protein